MSLTRVLHLLYQKAAFYARKICEFPAQIRPYPENCSNFNGRQDTLRGPDVVLSARMSNPQKTALPGVRSGVSCLKISLLLANKSVILFFGTN